MTRPVLTLAFIGVCHAAAVSAFAEGYVKFSNETTGQIRVEILHSDGKFQKGGYLDASDQKQFKFNSSTEKCKNKSRRFEVYQASGGSKVGSPVVAGEFRFKGAKLETGGGTVCVLTLHLMETNLQDLGFASGWKRRDIGSSWTTVPITRPGN